MRGRLVRDVSTLVVRGRVDAVQSTARTTPATRRAASPRECARVRALICLKSTLRASHSHHRRVYSRSVPFQGPRGLTHTAHRPRRDAGEASVGGAHKSPSLLSPGCELAATAAELVCTVVCAPPSAGERERLSATGRSVAKRASLVLGVNRSRALSASRCWWSNVEMNGGTAF